MNNHILVITDQDNICTLALDKANEIARQFRSNVEVVSFVDSKQSDIDVAAHDKLIRQHVANCFDDELNVTLQIVVTSDLAEWTKQHCQTNAIDLVIKTGHRSETLFYKPTDWQLLRKLDCPLMIVSDRKWRAKPSILAALDAGDQNPRQRQIDLDVLGIANHWAQVKGSQLHAVYTMEVPTAKVELDIIEIEQFEREKAPEAKRLLDQRVQLSNIEGIESKVEFGSPEKRIASYANRIKADLVVLGSVGRTGLNGLLLGNTAEKVLHNLRTDTLIIKPQKQL